MSLTNPARRERSPITKAAWLWSAAFALAAVAGSGCVSGQLAEQALPLETAGADALSSGGQAGSPFTPQAGASTAGAPAGGAETMPGGGAFGVAGAAGSAAGAPSAGANNNNGGASGMPGGAGSAGMVGGAGAPGACANKRGIAYAFAPTSAGPDMNALKPSLNWFYGWTAGPSAAAAPVMAGANMEFVPMVWNGSFKVADVENAIPASSKYLLGFNEPNFSKQANLTPAKAAALWPQIEQIAAQKQLKIVSPATNFCSGSCNQTDPFVWLDQFFAACPACKVDYIAVHWYACTLDALKVHITKMKKYNKPIWVTEFACVDGGPWSVAEVTAYAVAATAWLEQEPSVFRYSWFSGRDNIPNIALLGNSGALTPVGTAYVNAPHVCQ